MEDLNQLCRTARSEVEVLALAKSATAESHASWAAQKAARARLRHSVSAIVRHEPRDSAEAALREKTSGYLMSVCHVLDEPWMESMLLGDIPGDTDDFPDDVGGDRPLLALAQIFWAAFRAFDPAEVATSRDRSQHARDALNAACREILKARPASTVGFSEKLKAIACVGLAQTFHAKAPPYVTPAEAIVHREILVELVELDATFFMLAFMSDDDAASLSDQSDAAQVLAAGRIIRYAVTIAGEAALRSVHADASRLLSTSVH